MIGEGQRMSLSDSSSVVEAGSGGGNPGDGLTHVEGSSSARIVRMCGVAFHAVTEPEAIERIVTASRRGNGGRVVTPNLHILRFCTRDREVRRLVEGADLRLADGMPVLWASWVRGTPLPQRVAGSNLIYSLSEAAADAGLSVFMLGGNPGMADAASTILCERYPGLRVVGTSCPPFGFENDPETHQRVIREVVDARPDLVFVGLGCPKQERLMEQLSQRLPRAWMLGIGFSFSFVAGEASRAPRWMQKIGMEWLHRLSKEPRRLTRRYLLEGIPFFAWLLTASVAARVAGKPRGGATVE